MITCDSKVAIERLFLPGDFCSIPVHIDLYIPGSGLFMVDAFFFARSFGQSVGRSAFSISFSISFSTSRSVSQSVSQSVIRPAAGMSVHFEGRISRRKISGADEGSSGAHGFQQLGSLPVGSPLEFKIRDECWVTITHTTIDTFLNSSNIIITAHVSPHAILVQCSHPAIVDPFVNQLCDHVMTVRLSAIWPQDSPNPTRSLQGEQVTFRCV